MEAFNQVYMDLFGEMHDDWLPLLDDGTMTRLWEVYNNLSTSERDVDVVPLERSRPYITIDSRAECNILTSVETLGDALLTEKRHVEAYNCYWLLYAYLQERFGRQFILARAMKKKIARVLIDCGQYGMIIDEMRDDANMELCDTDMANEATAYIKYAYGRALLEMDLSLAAIPYLSHQYLGYMDTEKSENMEVLCSIANIVFEQIRGGRAEFAVCLTKRLMTIFSVRMHRGDCPSEIFKLVATVCGNLWMDQGEGCMVELFQRAYTIHSNCSNIDTLLLLSIVGVSYPDGSLTFVSSMEAICRIHNYLLSTLRGNNHSNLKLIMVTTKLIFIFHSREEAVPILLNTYRKLMNVVRIDNAMIEFVLFCLRCRLNPQY